MSENLTNKTCGECKYFNGLAHGFCKNKQGRLSVQMNDPICQNYKPKLTNGDKIIAGGMRELAKAMVYGYRETDGDGQVTGGMLYTWHLPNAKVFDEYNEAVDYLEEWLNAPAESEVTK